MGTYFAVGFGTGMLFYLVKLAGFYIGTSGTKFGLWIREFFHKTGWRLFIFDILAGVVISHAISLVGASGLVALFIFIGFSTMSIVYIAARLTVRKLKEVRRRLCPNGLLS